MYTLAIALFTNTTSAAAEGVPHSNSPFLANKLAEI